MHGYLGTKGARLPHASIAQAELFDRLRDQTRGARYGLSGISLGLREQCDAYAIEAPAGEWVARSSGVADRAASQP